jgi:hypothetical protein
MSSEVVMLKTIAAAICGVVVCSGTASAQVLSVWQEKIFVNISFGGTSGAGDVTQQFSFPYLDETATIDSTRPVKGGGLFDFTAGAMVIDNWAAGISFSHHSAKSSATFTGNIPDPIFPDMPRVVTGSLPDMVHSEDWFAFLGGYLLPKLPKRSYLPDFTERMDIMVFAGPVRAGVEHEVVSAATVTEGGSGPEVTLDRQVIHKGFWGVQVGVDLRYMFTRNIGAGGFLRFSGASGDVTEGVNLDLGGFQGGAGVRFKF